MSNHSNQPSSLGPWILPIIFLFCLPPVGALMIALKLFGSDRKVRVDGSHPYQSSNQGYTGAKTTIRQTTSSASSLSPLTAKSKKLSAIGGVIAGISLFVLTASAGDSAHWLFQGQPMFFLEEMVELLPFWCGLGGGLGLWWAGHKMKKKLRNWRQYLAMIGKNTTISISALSSATGHSAAEVRADLQEMLDDGWFPTGFLDYGGDRLVLSAEGIREEAPKTAEEKKKDAAAEENAVLSEIRAINDSIENKQISAQIDRIGIITTKIFDYQKSHPKKAPELHSFLSYYLPTTLKILRSYAQLEAQGVQGENITAAMHRIEEMMDKVVEGFEKQLDQLFRTDTMDITSDVQVLEQMLKKDGLSGDGIQLHI
jgi:hypothetical protein